MNHVRVVLVEMQGSDEAVQAAIQQFLVQGIDSGSAVIPRPASDDLAIPPAAALPARPALAAPRRTAKRKRNARSNQEPLPPSPVDAAQPGSSSRATILAALAKRPMTSGEVITATGLERSAVYSMLNVLRNEGLVESRKLDGEIYPKQFLVAK